VVDPETAAGVAASEKSDNCTVEEADNRTRDSSGSMRGWQRFRGYPAVRLVALDITLGMGNSYTTLTEIKYYLGR
jgi:hypothetical protein